MNAPRLAWAITGSGHYIEESLTFMLTLDNVDLYLSQAGEEVLKMYGIKLAELQNRLPVYRDKAASAPPVGLFYKGYYHTFVMAPTTSNTVAKCVLGIADTSGDQPLFPSRKMPDTQHRLSLRHRAGNGNDRPRT